MYAFFSPFLDQMSRDMLERLALLPFSGGCISQYGTEVLDQQCAKRSRSVVKWQSPSTSSSLHRSLCFFAQFPYKCPVYSKLESLRRISVFYEGKQEDEYICSQALLYESMKNSAPGSFMPIPRLNISHGLQRLLKNIKSMSKLFPNKDETYDPNLQIGLPTNVKHVTHIGWDGPETSNLINGWEALLQPPKLHPIL
ncbi:unnamed protein product [Rhodiola kirilowii]